MKEELMKLLRIIADDVDWEMELVEEDEDYVTALCTIDLLSARLYEAEELMSKLQREKEGEQDE